MADEYLEREHKYDVDESFVLPDFEDAAPQVDRVESATTQQLEATYFDTADGALRERRITLRRRAGGDDAGWHAKLPASDGRLEVRLPPRRGTVPRELSQLLLGVRRGRRLTVVATISTNRVSHRLLNTDGELLAEIADDHVQAASTADRDHSLDWREVEIELGPAGDDALLDRLGERLVDVGAELSPCQSKLARTLGPLPERPGRKRLGGLVDDYLRVQIDAIVDGDLALRREVNAVHPTRVAVRRLRSTLRVFCTLFEAEERDRLDAELVWLAELLGAVRDIDVMRRRLLEQVDELTSELVLGPVRSTIESTLAADRRDAAGRLVRAMRGKRYLALLDTLATWRLDPPFTDEAARPKSGVAEYVDRAGKQQRKRLRRASKPSAEAAVVHQARKATKRFRYANELAVPVLAGPAKKRVKRAKQLQKLLGEHQDSVVSAGVLRRLGAAAGDRRGENGFTYGVLLGQEWRRADVIHAAVGRVKA